TLTTTGYGDIVAVDPFARSLANLESVIGQFYLAITVARLVTLELADRHRYQSHKTRSLDKGTMMKRDFVAVLLACCLAACAQSSAPQQPTPPPAPAAPPPEAASPPAPRVTSEAQIAPGRWDVARVRCSDLLGADDDDRAAAVMFYYGYLAAKAGIRVIDVSRIDGNVRKVMDRCAAAPNITVPQAFRQALGRRG